MKADKYRRITIPAYIMKRTDIEVLKAVTIVKGDGYGKFYLSSDEKEETWKAISHFDCGTKLRLPKGIYSASANYKVFLENGRVCILKSA